MLRLIVLFIGVPIIEMMLLIRLGQELGFWPTIALVVFTGLLGSTLTRQQGSAVWHQFNAKLQGGQLPGKEIVDGLIVLIAGALLLTPGVLTDFVGFLGLLPYTRQFIRKFAQKKLESAQSKGSVGFQFNTFGGPSPFQAPPSQPNTDWQGIAKDKPDHSD